MRLNKSVDNNLHSAGVKISFSQVEILILEFILLITFRTIDSPEIVSSNVQPKYVAFE